MRFRQALQELLQARARRPGAHCRCRHRRAAARDARHCAGRRAGGAGRVSSERSAAGQAPARPISRAIEPERPSCKQPADVVLFMCMADGGHSGASPTVLAASTLCPVDAYFQCRSGDEHSVAATICASTDACAPTGREVVCYRWMLFVAGGVPEFELRACAHGWRAYAFNVRREHGACSASTGHSRLRCCKQAQPPKTTCKV